MYDAVLRLREILIKVAKRRGSITYAEASETINRAYIPQNLGKRAFMEVQGTVSVMITGLAQQNFNDPLALDCPYQ